MPTTGRVDISRARAGSPQPGPHARGAGGRPPASRPPTMDSVNVEVDADEDQRPEDRRQNPRDDRLDAVDVLPVVVRGGDDPADDQVEHHEPADADARRGPRSGCIAHFQYLPVRSSFAGSNEQRASAGTEA